MNGDFIGFHQLVQKLERIASIISTFEAGEKSSHIFLQPIPGWEIFGLQFDFMIK